MPKHIEKLIISMLDDYQRLIKNALDEKDEKRIKTIEEADEKHSLIKNLILEYKK